MKTLLLLLALTNVAQLQAGPLTVSPKCTSMNGMAEITVDASDKDASVFVECDEELTMAVWRSRRSNTYKARVSYDSNNHCRFMSDEESNEVYVNILVYYGPAGSEHLNQQKRWKAICKQGDEEGRVEELPEVQMDYAYYDEASSIITIPMQLVGKNGRTVDQARIPFGSQPEVQLVGNTQEYSDESIHVVSCDAIGGETHVQILQEGCGNDMVLGVNEGFDIDGTVVKSPFFPFVAMEGAQEVQYMCNFTQCDGETCEGNSCVPHVVKRAASGDEDPGFLPMTAVASDVSSIGAVALISFVVVFGLLQVFYYWHIR